MIGSRRGLRAVIDTNVIISGVIRRRGHPFEVLEAWRAAAFSMLISDEQRQELEEVLGRPAIRTKYGLSDDEVGKLLHLLDRTASRVHVKRRLPVPVRDKKDEAILSSALGGKADFLVTGDADLLALRDSPALGDLRIVTVIDFSSILAGRGSDIAPGV